MSIILDQVFASGTKPISNGTNNTSGTPNPTMQIASYNTNNASNPDYNDNWIDDWGGVYGVDVSGNLTAVPTLGVGNAAFFKTMLIRPISEKSLNQRVSIYFNFDSAMQFSTLLRVNPTNRTGVQVIINGNGNYSGYGLENNWGNSTGPLSGTFTPPANGTPCIFISTITSTFGITSITPTSIGSGYTIPPTVTIMGDGSGATATATLGSVIGTKDKVLSYTITAPGENYTYAYVVVAPNGDKGMGATAITNLGNQSDIIKADIVTEADPTTSLGSATREDSDINAGSIGFNNLYSNLSSINITRIKYETLDSVEDIKISMPRITGDSTSNIIGLDWTGGLQPVRASLYEYNGTVYNTTGLYPLANYTNVGTILSPGSISRTPPTANNRKYYRWLITTGSGEFYTSPTGVDVLETGDSIFCFSAPRFNNPIKMFFVGDSITAGDSTNNTPSTQIRVALDFLSMVYAPCNVEGWNYGTSGSKSADWLQGQSLYNNLKDGIIAKSSSFSANTVLLIHIMLGTNDAQSDVEGSVLTNNINSLISSLTTDLVNANVTQTPKFIISHIPYNYIVNFNESTIAANNAIDNIDYNSNILRGATNNQIYEMTGSQPEIYEDNNYNDAVHPGSKSDSKVVNGNRSLGLAWGYGIYNALNPIISIRKINLEGGI